MLASLFIAFALTVAANARLVNFKVTGIFLCKENPNSQVFLELREHDNAGDDDTLSWTIAPVNEPFEIKGNHTELFAINPYLRIVHTCRDVQEEIIVEFGKRTRDTTIYMQFVDLQDETLKDLLRNKYVNA